jgi:hypothetical protein
VGDIDGAYVREAELAVEVVEPGVVLGAVEAKPWPIAVCYEAGGVADEVGADPAACVRACVRATASRCR